MKTASVIKAGGKRSTEPFSSKKLKKSIVATCLSLRTPDGQAEEIAESVEKSVLRWLKDKPEVTSADIRRVAAKILKKYHPEAAYLYGQQLLVL